MGFGWQIPFKFNGKSFSEPTDEGHQTPWYLSLSLPSSLPPSLSLSLSLSLVLSLSLSLSLSFSRSLSLSPSLPLSPALSLSLSLYLSLVLPPSLSISRSLYLSLALSVHTPDMLSKRIRASSQKLETSIQNLDPSGNTFSDPTDEGHQTPPPWSRVEGKS